QRMSGTSSLFTSLSTELSTYPEFAGERSTCPVASSTDGILYGPPSPQGRQFRRPAANGSKPSGPIQGTAANLGPGLSIRHHPVPGPGQGRRAVAGQIGQGISGGPRPRYHPDTVNHAPANSH